MFTSHSWTLKVLTSLLVVSVALPFLGGVGSTTSLMVRRTRYVLVRRLISGKVELKILWNSLLGIVLFVLWLVRFERRLEHGGFIIK